MTFLIRTVDRTATGREIVREREVAGDKLTIGRATTNDIVLPDLAVEQHHAVLERVADGRLRMVSTSAHGFVHDGRKTTDSSFRAGGGGEFVFGLYSLLFAKESDGRAAITITQQEREFGNRDAIRGFDLDAAMPSKRILAWLGMAAILLAFLAVPIWTHLNRANPAPGADGTDQVRMDAAWSTGKLSQAHHALEQNCEACHVEPFQSVRDETCLTCHESIGYHAGKPRLASARGPLSRGDALLWEVAETFGKEGPEACTTCHTEHEGAGRMEPAAQQFCSSCHDTMDQRLADTALANASDFGTNHPQLQALVYQTPGSETVTRIALDGKARENSGLRFPHDMHLSQSNGVARMAGNLGKYGEALECADCHRPTDDNNGFLPVRMEEDCESCHSLVYDKVGTTFRTLRHGDVDQMRADLIAMDRAPRRPITSGRRRPGDFARGGRYYQNFGKPTQNYIGISRALSRDGVCGECHLPTTDKGRPSVIPVNLRSDYFINGRFDHEAHEQEECSTCHKADSSDAATDVLLPGIATCRECHLGEAAKQADVPSTCAMCHSYHPKGRKPEDHPDGAPKQVARISRETG
ncbi:cytochrome c3 family protein [Qipengyuania marisflavi]|uniref:FHA domain-containing protein n=1 Tax=Qipengyuania marisflavi TaxID=2486356 RepID=A0A5S3P2X2_9SPHN|nr:cytochrome c3 family protein [Qipengyuania marisflavi]TMM47301.1 hypothetical protein FEV51_09530 [Qipengyuania marisflavi]